MNSEFFSWRNPVAYSLSRRRGKPWHRHIRHARLQPFFPPDVWYLSCMFHLFNSSLPVPQSHRTSLPQLSIFSCSCMVCLQREHRQTTATSSSESFRNTSPSGMICLPLATNYPLRLNSLSFFHSLLLVIIYFSPWFFFLALLLLFGWRKRALGLGENQWKQWPKAGRTNKGSDLRPVHEGKHKGRATVQHPYHLQPSAAQGLNTHTKENKAVMN